MAIALNYFSSSVSAGAGNGVPAGIYIPQATDLPGLVSAELASTEPKREEKVAFSLVNQLAARLTALTAPLGMIGTAQATQPGGGANLVNLPFQFVTEFMFNLSNNMTTPIPLPTGDAGLVAIDDIFPNAAIVSAEATVAAAGLVVPTTTITGHGGSQPANVNVADGRSWVMALIRAIVLGVDLTDNAIATAVVGNQTGFAARAAFTAATNPTSGILAADLPMRRFFSMTHNISFRVNLNNTTQSFDLV